jgi:predicted amidohydrolase
VGENRAYVLGVLERALRQEPDLVCLPEAFTTAGVPARQANRAVEGIPGPTTDAIAARASRHHCYVICPIMTRRDGKIYNSAVIIDRSGAICGVYDKVHPVTTSHDYTVFEGGATPGRSAPVFDLDFGRIGIQICFDAGFPETWAVLARKGAKAVFWPSAYIGGFPLQAYACIQKYYVISSVRGDTSRIINPCGRIVAETDVHVNIAAYDLNLDFAVCHYDFNFGIPDRIMDTYAERVRIQSYTEDPDFLVEPTSTEITIRQLQEEFGFEPASLYYDRHRQGYRRILSGQKPLAQQAAHGARAQFAKQ